MATSWKDLLNRRDVLILDTETTGFDASSEVVDIAMIDTTGTRRFNAPVLPKGPIPRAASNIHGLTRAKLESLGARPWSDVHSRVVALLNSASTVLIYNAAYDLRLLGQTAKRYALSFSFDRSKIHCIQLAYAALRREPRPYRAGEWKWHKLAEATPLNARAASVALQFNRTVQSPTAKWCWRCCGRSQQGQVPGPCRASPAIGTRCSGARRFARQRGAVLYCTFPRRVYLRLGRREATARKKRSGTGKDPHRHLKCCPDSEIGIAVPLRVQVGQRMCARNGPAMCQEHGRRNCALGQSALGRLLQAPLHMWPAAQVGPCRRHSQACRHRRRPPSHALPLAALRVHVPGNCMNP